MVPDQWTDRLSGLRTIDRQTYELNKEVDRDIDYENIRWSNWRKDIQTNRYIDRPIDIQTNLQTYIYIILKTLRYVTTLQAHTSHKYRHTYNKHCYTGNLSPLDLLISPSLPV